MKIVLPALLAEELEPQVRAIVPAARIVYFDDQSRPLAPVDDAEVLLRWWGPPQMLIGLVERMPALRWLHIPRAGVDSSLVPAVVDRDILVTNSAGVHAIPISEFVLMFMLSHIKRVPELLLAQGERRWDKSLAMNELAGRTVLVIGMGQIGRAIAARASAFEMRVLGSSRSGRPQPGVERVVSEGEWRALIPEADYVVLAAPLTPATRGMFGAAELAAMRPSAYLINIARGEIVDEGALIAALERGQIAGAGIDVFSTEPLPAASPLWGLPNVFVTPHISWTSPEIRPRTIHLFIENLRRYVAGEPLRNLVDKHAGY
jgi:phosphoglycerate dehydrogenase-like enzyme